MGAPSDNFFNFPKQTIKLTASEVRLSKSTHHYPHLHDSSGLPPLYDSRPSVTPLPVDILNWYKHYSLYLTNLFKHTETSSLIGGNQQMYDRKWRKTWLRQVVRPQHNGHHTDLYIHTMSTQTSLQRYSIQLTLPALSICPLFINLLLHTLLKDVQCMM